MLLIYTSGLVWCGGVGSGGGEGGGARGSICDRGGGLTYGGGEFCAIFLVTSSNVSYIS